MNDDGLKTEWCLLQTQFDSDEKHALYIKLLSIALVFLAELLGAITMFALFIIIVLWLQDAIWKTFQSRIESRLLQVEQLIAEDGEAKAFQFNSEYQKTSLSGVALIMEYASQAIRPTIAFPYAVLVLIVVVQLLV